MTDFINATVTAASATVNKSFTSRRFLPPAPNGFVKSMTYLLPALLLAGLFSNLLIIIVMRNKAYTEIPLKVYFTALAFGDSVSLILFGVRQWLWSTYRFPLWFAPGYCHAYVLFKNIAPPFSAWLIFFTSLDRLLVVMFPLKARRYSTVSSAKAVVATLAVVNIVVGAASWFAIEFPKCGQVKYPYQGYTRFILKVIVNHMLPCLGTAVCYVVMMKSFLKKRKQIADATSSNRNPANRMTVSAMSVCLAFLILTTPDDVRELDVFLGLGILPKSSIPDLSATGAFFILINYSINFFINLATSKLFRKTTKSLFKRQKVEAASYTT